MENNTGNDATLANSGQDDQSMASFQSSVLAMLGNMRSDMQSMQAKIADLDDRTQSVPASPYKSKGKGRAPLRRSLEEDGNAERNQHGDDDRQERESSVVSDGTARNKNWADRDNEVMDYTTELVWDDEDDDQPDSKGVKLFKIGEKTEKFLTSAFATALPNATRRQWRDKYGAPNTPATACPNLDKVIKGRLPAATKSRDKQLAKQQALMLDAVGPITHLLEEAVKGQLSQKSAVEAAQTALKFLGNASVQSSRERRRNALQSMNSRLLDMADDDGLFKSAPPLLFGEGFCKKAKERDDELKCLNQASSSKATGPGGSRDTRFFRGGRSQYQQSHGSGQNTRGRRGGYQRQHPYRTPQSQWSKTQESKKTQN